jgi:phage tail-like protein
MPSVPARGDEEPLLAHHISLTFDSQVTSLLISFDGLESKHEVCEAIHTGLGGKELPASRTPGKLSIDPLEIQLYALKGDMFFENWFKSVQGGKIESSRKDGTIHMYDQLNTVVGEWQISASWPSKLSYSDLDASSNDAMKLTVTLICEGFRRIQ